MKRILIESQKDLVYLTIFADYISIGRRNDNYLIGEKLDHLLKEKNMDLEALIKDLGNSYRDNFVRISKNEEIPNKKMLDRLTNYFEVENDYFSEKELHNVIITDNNIVVGKYDTDERTKEVFEKLNALIVDGYTAGRPIYLQMPEK